MDYHESFTNIGQSSDGQRPLIEIRILVVDDDATTLAVVSSMLQIWSYKVETAKNPLDALATLRMQKGLFDLVVTDLHMPFMNGFELQKQIDKEFKLPVIMMSADDQENVLLQSLQSGISLYLTKPVSPDDLKDVWQFVVRAKKGKSIVIEEIGSNDTTLDHDNQREGQDHRHDQSFGGSSTGISGALISRNPGNYQRASSHKDIDHGGGKGKKKSCNQKDPNHDQEQRRKRPKKIKVIWTNSLHNRFLLSIRHLGYDKAVPKRILEYMNVPGLTRENVASHLQKYRLFLKRVAENGVLDATMALTDRFMRSSFAAGYPIQLMLQHAQQMYPHLYRQAHQPMPSQPNTNTNTALTVMPPPPTPPSSSSSSFRFANNHGHEASSNRVSLPPVGLSTLLADNSPPAAATGNFVSQSMVSRASTAAAAANYSYGYNNVNHGSPEDSSFLAGGGGGGGLNVATQMVQQRVTNQVRPGLVARRNYAFNGNFERRSTTTSSASGIRNQNYTLAIGNNVVGSSSTNANNSSAGANRIISGSGAVLTRFNQQWLNYAGGGVANGQFGLGGVSGGGCGVGIGVGNSFDYGQNSAKGQAQAGGFDQVDQSINLPAAPAPPPVFIDYQQQPALNNANHDARLPLPPPPPPQPLPQYPNGLQNPGGRGNVNYNYDLGDQAVNNNAARITDNMSTNFGGNGYVDPFLNQNNQLPTTLPTNYELRVEDYASDLSDISHEEADHRVMINQVNASENQAAIIQDPDLFAAGPPRTDHNGVPNVEQPFGQFQGIEQDLQNLGGNAFPSAEYFPRINQSPLQPQGNIEQVLHNPVGNALPSDSYFPGLNQIPLQPQGNIEQVLQNPGGNALPSANYFPVPVDQTTPLQVQPQGNEQVLYNPAGCNAPSYSDAYFPRIDQTPPQQPGSVEVADPFQNIDLENLLCEVDWGEFMECLLNDSAPDLRE